MVLRSTALMRTLAFIGMVFVFNKKKENNPTKKLNETVDPSMICKFVLDSAGKKIGESVSVSDDVLIIKSGSLFLGVPLKHVETGEKTLVVKGIFDFTKAYELGEKWRKESYRGMNQYGCPEEQSKRF
jgi:hypothetical protein